MSIFIERWRLGRCMRDQTGRFLMQLLKMIKELRLNYNAIDLMMR